MNIEEIKCEHCELIKSIIKTVEETRYYTGIGGSVSEVSWRSAVDEIIKRIRKEYHIHE